MSATARVAASVRRTPVSWVLFVAGLAFFIVGFSARTGWPFIIAIALATVRLVLVGWNLRHRHGRQW